MEGKFYVWSASEIDALLPAGEAAVLRAVYGVSPSGNWEGQNILERVAEPAGVGEDLNLSPDEAEARLAAARDTLYRERSRRVWPARDEKVITAWNAMAITAFARAGQILDRAAYTAAAIECAEFLLAELRRDGRLLRTWRDGTAHIDAFLVDHGLFAGALVDLYYATFDHHWLEIARSIADDMIGIFWDSSRGVFFDAPEASNLVIRPRDIYDNATPSGTSAAVSALLRLARLFDDEGYERIAQSVLRSLSRVATEVPQGFGNLLAAMTHTLASPTEVVIAGDRDDPGTEDLLKVVHSRYLPHTTLALHPATGSSEALSRLIPMVEGREPLNGEPTAYVCRHHTCKLPVTHPAALELDLDALVAPPEL